MVQTGSDRFGLGFTTQPPAVHGVGFESGERWFLMGGYSPDSQGSGVLDFPAVVLLSSSKKVILFESIC